MRKIAAEQDVPLFNFDLLSDKEKFVPRKEVLERLVTEHKLLLIDEIQNYPEATVALKILHDEFQVKVIATGSSELRQKSADFDSLAGRFEERYCLPLSVFEITNNAKPLTYEKDNFVKRLTEDGLLYGVYPEVYTSIHTESDKIDLLQNILDTYVLKDVISLYDLKNEKLARDILTKIALQIGSEVSIREIASSLSANVTTVSSYIEIFIKNYILIPLPSFKTNARRAVSEHRKLYFYDLGIRNILVRDFRPLSLRPDSGGVFENFIIAEIEKKRRITNAKQTMYFYREYGGREIDLVVEDYKKKYTCMEIKIQEEVSNQQIFPLPHTFVSVNGRNYFEKIDGIF